MTNKSISRNQTDFRSLAKSVEKLDACPQGFKEAVAAYGISSSKDSRFEENASRQRYQMSVKERVPSLPRRKKMKKSTS